MDDHRRLTKTDEAGERNLQKSQIASSHLKFGGKQRNVASRLHRDSCTLTVRASPYLFLNSALYAHCGVGCIFALVTGAYCSIGLILGSRA